MARRKRSLRARWRSMLGRWGLRSFELEFSALFAKFRLVFGKRVTRRVVSAEQPVQPDIFGNTLLDIAEKERKKAIGGGRYIEAIGISAFEQGLWGSVKRRRKKGKEPAR